MKIRNYIRKIFSFFLQIKINIGIKYFTICDVGPKTHRVNLLNAKEPFLIFIYLEVGIAPAIHTSRWIKITLFYFKNIYNNVLILLNYSILSLNFLQEMSCCA